MKGAKPEFSSAGEFKILTPHINVLALQKYYVR